MDELTALRAAFAPWYSPYRPHFPTALFVIFVTLTILLIAIGHLLGAAYDVDVPSRSSSSPSSGDNRGKEKEDWVKRELAKRRSEKDDPAKTEARVRKEAEKERADKKSRQGKMKAEDFEKWRQAEESRRKKDMASLRKALEKEKLPLVALDPPVNSKSRSKAPPDAPPDNTERGSGTPRSMDTNKGVTDESWRNKLKHVVAGGNLAQGLSRPSKRSAVDRDPAFQIQEASGSVLQSAAHAEGNAARLKAEMAR